MDSENDNDNENDDEIDLFQATVPNKIPSLEINNYNFYQINQQNLKMSHRVEEATVLAENTNCDLHQNKNNDETSPIFNKIHQNQKMVNMSPLARACIQENINSRLDRHRTSLTSNGTPENSRRRHSSNFSSVGLYFWGFG